MNQPTDIPQQDAVSITAYEIYTQTDMNLIPAPAARPWMDRSQSRFAYRCLPMTLVNQAGWIIQCPRSFVAKWNGGPRASDTSIVFDQTPPDPRITSLFGHGVVTFNMPYLFRTSPECNLWVKGPSNWPKHGLCPLEGLIEADWTSATFTMNWKITQANTLVTFSRGEPICMIVPFPRGLLEKTKTFRRALSTDPQLESEYIQWSIDRSEFQVEIARGDVEATRRGWQKDYFQGRDPGKDRFTDHQTRLMLRPFE